METKNRNMYGLTLLAAILFAFSNSMAQTIDISKQGLFINQKILSRWIDKAANKYHSGWNYGEFKEVLGNPDRTHCCDLTHTYDSLGIVLWEGIEYNEKGNDHVKAMDIYFDVGPFLKQKPFEGNVQFFDADGNPLKIDSTTERQNPTSLTSFMGTITVEGLTLTPKTTKEEIGRVLKRWKNKESYLANHYYYFKDDIYIYFTYDASETELIQVTIGEKRYYMQ